MGFRKSTIAIVFLVITVTLLGVFGYSFIEGWSLFDSLYMTMITLSTTGYQEVQPLSPEGRIFTMVLLVVGMGTVAYSASHIIQDLLSINLKTQRRRRMEKKLGKLHNHTIVCGFGRMGQVTCRELAREGAEFVVIERDTKPIHELEKTEFNWIEGDATHDDILQMAGVQNARALVCMVDNDADSLYISLAGRSLNKNIFIISRATEESARKKILRAGADRVVLPIVVSGMSVAHSVLNPAFEDFLDIAGVDLHRNKRIQMAEIQVGEGSDFIGKALSACDFQKKGLVVVGVRHPDGGFTFGPDASYALSQEDTLITLSTPDSYSHLIKNNRI